MAAVKMSGVNVEAVLKVEDDEENGGKRKNKSKQKEAVDDLGLSVLIDSQNNQYVLTKPRDSTIPRADHHFIKVTPPIPAVSASSDFTCEKWLLMPTLQIHIYRTWCLW